MSENKYKYTSNEKLTSMCNFVNDALPGSCRAELEYRLRGYSVPEKPLSDEDLLEEFGGAYHHTLVESDESCERRYARIRMQVLARMAGDCVD